MTANRNDVLAALANEMEARALESKPGVYSPDYRTACLHYAGKLREALAAPAEGGQGGWQTVPKVANPLIIESIQSQTGMDRAMAQQFWNKLLYWATTPPAASVDVEALRELRDNCFVDFHAQPINPAYDSMTKLIDSAGGAKVGSVSPQMQDASAVSPTMSEKPAEGDGAVAFDKLHIGGVESDDERCLRCGSMFLDTGWECNDCGYDNMPHYANPVDSNEQKGEQP